MVGGRKIAVWAGSTTVQILMQRHCTAALYTPYYVHSAWPGSNRCLLGVGTSRPAEPQGHLRLSTTLYLLVLSKENHIETTKDAGE